MPFKEMQNFTFNHSDQQDAIYTDYTATQIKALFDSRGVELRTALNLLVNALNSTEGAANIGTNSIQDVDGENIQSMLKSIRDRLKSKADGSSGADFINATSIDGLTGETVQSVLESLNNKITTTFEGVKASNISADQIAVGSGTTVQSQLAWLLSQIAVAATGSIPDGSITEVKLAQALVEKINKALSNVGVLTTLLTNDKSSLVNALNEHLNDGSAHGIGNKNTLATSHKTTLVGAINEAFSLGNSRKTELVDLLLSLDNGLPITHQSTWEQILSAAEDISTGKKWAIGTNSSSALGGVSSLTVSGLDFTPSIVIAYGIVNNFFNYCIAFNPSKRPFPYKFNNNGTVVNLNMIRIVSSSSGQNTSLNYNATFNTNGFYFEVEYANTAYNWIAYE